MDFDFKIKDVLFRLFLIILFVLAMIKVLAVELAMFF
jgi:hypothetical protein